MNAKSTCYDPQLRTFKLETHSQSFDAVGDAISSRRSGSPLSPPTADVQQKIDVNPPKGTRDFPPEEMRLRNWIFQNFREVSRLFGFEELDFPVLESETPFIRKAGEEIRDQRREAVNHMWQWSISYFLHLEVMIHQPVVLDSVMQSLLNC
ncbi:hypothetical protein Nepgr_011674 [Nepenthes gracilis]|uniref:histidine--tRNA ligase n=1 Tax=Nepenthes gracilis TaxID=150966 RepID=A0AAD3SES2_NEPGR|nr:hypothetical protein Nepgr_011674 [Nepenthes gracilis]